ncbi:hypothetical protein ABDB91_17330 [Desulfoscipio sp. XC116]|uniref:hypothetical protein n=1 Tax=Desulfoscipio sp. XC116 TaxID=3144975 RepID=UPI00325B35CE
MLEGINVNNGLLCGFLEKTIPVNELQAKKKEDFNLSFALVNSAGEDCSFSNDDELTVEQAEELLKKGARAGRTSALTITATVNDQEEALFRDKDDMGSFLCEEGWQATSWVQDQFNPESYSCMIFYKTRMDLPPLKTISFQLLAGVSSAIPGICRINASLENIKNIKNTCFAFDIIKQPAKLNLRYFYPTPSAGASGNKITLKWKAGNLTEGVINPGNINICSPELMNADSCDIILKDTCEYRLTVTGSDGGRLEKRLMVYKAPPEIIDFSYLHAANKIRWEVYGAGRIAITGRENIPMSGEDAVKEDENKLTLTCQGDVCAIEQTLVFRGEGFIDNSLFSKTVYKYAGYQKICVRWNMEAANDVNLWVEQLRYYDISNAGSGIWENVFSSKVVPVFKMKYKTADQKEIVISL